MEKSYTGRQNQGICRYVQDRLADGTAKEVFGFKTDNDDFEIKHYSLTDPEVAVLLLQNHRDFMSKNMSIVTGRKEDISELEKRTKR